MKEINDDELVKVIGGTNANTGTCGKKFGEQEWSNFDESNGLCLSCPGKPLLKMETRKYEIKKGDKETTATFGLKDIESADVVDWGIVENK